VGLLKARINPKWVGAAMAKLLVIAHVIPTRRVLW
jgi:hypothetical protein